MTRLGGWERALECTRAALDIAAASLRAAVAAGRSIRFLVPAAVEAYIAERRLYRKEDARR